VREVFFVIVQVKLADSEPISINLMTKFLKKATFYTWIQI